MTTKIEFQSGGGLFSYYGLLLESLSVWIEKGQIQDSDILYVDSLVRAPTNIKRKNPGRRRLENIKFNVFDHVLDQTKPTNLSNFKRVLSTNQQHPVYYKEFEPKKERYKKISKQFLKIHPNLMKKAVQFSDNNFIPDKTLGVHIRMTDMNRCHANLGNVYFSDYVEKINEILETNDIEKIFIASDNNESIEKLQHIYKDKICFFETPFRVDKETNETTKYLLKNSMKVPQSFEDSMIDALLLAHCNITCGRISLFNWGSQSFHFSKIQKYYHIAGQKK